MKFLYKYIYALFFLLMVNSVSAQYFSGYSNFFNMDTKNPSVSAWCPEAGSYYLPGQFIYLSYAVYENNLTSLALWYSSEEGGGGMQMLMNLPSEGPLEVQLPMIPTFFAKLYIIADDSFGHQTVQPIPSEGYFTIGTATQTIEVPQGWSGISSAYIPVDPTISNIFSDVIDDVIIFQDFENVFWPGGNVYTLTQWDVFSGYIIKAENPFILEIEGTSLDCDQGGSISEGWDILPIIAECDLDAVNFFSWNLWSSVIIKEVAGWRVLWPQYNIKTLEVLERGRSFYVYSTMDNNDFMFMPCWEGEKSDKNFVNPTTWNNPVSTNISHTIAIPQNVIDNNQTISGCYFGAFTADGICSGIAGINDNCLTVFGDDPTTEITEGFSSGELMMFKIFDTQANKEIIPEVLFSYDMPQYDGKFASNGLSVISSIKTGTMGVDETVQNNVLIYPNPSKGIFNIEILDCDQIFETIVTNTQGKEILKIKIRKNAVLDLSDFDKGIYFVKFISGEKVIIKKVVID